MSKNLIKDISYANNNLINAISFNLNTQTQITRDDKNNIIKTSIGDEYILYEYDKKDNLISAKRYTNNKLACVLQYEYNTNNKLISCIQDGIEIKRRYNHEKDNSSLKHILFLNEVISYDINPKTNLLDQITIGLHDINLEYNNNQLTKKTFTSYLKSDEINMDNLEQTIQLNHKRDLHNQIDINNKIIKQTQTMFYDTNNQIEQISTNNTNIKYQRDKTNLITQIDDNEKITNYTYDNGKRLISACDDKINLKTIQKQPQHIKSDILNLTNDKFVISNFLQEPIKEEKINIDGFTQYEYDKVGNLLNNNSVYKNNQLVQNDNYYYVYDKAGNLKAKKSTTTSKQIEYRYNNFNELISVKYYIKAKLVKTLLFTYDALRRRASKQLIDNINNYKHYYLYDGLNIIAILDSNKQLLSTITHNNELDSPLSITTNNKTYFYYTNAQGSITHLTNCHGNIVEKISYDAYGNITNHIQKEKTNNIYFFTAKQKDDIDLYYYKFRYYDATTFRFICLDPISHESNDTNHYSYVFNDPLNQTDDLGLYTPGSLSLALNPIKPPTQYKTMLGQTTKTNIQKQSLQTETKEFKTPTIKEIVANAPRDGVKILAGDGRSDQTPLEIKILFVSSTSDQFINELDKIDLKDFEISAFNGKKEQKFGAIGELAFDKTKGGFEYIPSIKDGENLFNSIQITQKVENKENKTLLFITEYGALEDTELYLSPIINGENNEKYNIAIGGGYKVKEKDKEFYGIKIGLSLNLTIDCKVGGVNGDEIHNASERKSLVLPLKLKTDEDGTQIVIKNSGFYDDDFEKYPSKTIQRTNANFNDFRDFTTGAISFKVVNYNKDIYTGDKNNVLSGDKDGGDYLDSSAAFQTGTQDKYFHTEFVSTMVFFMVEVKGKNYIYNEFRNFKLIEDSNIKTIKDLKNDLYKKYVYNSNYSKIQFMFIHLLFDGKELTTKEIAFDKIFYDTDGNLIKDKRV